MPVNPVFIWASLAAGLAINMLPLGRVVWMPDLLMVLLVFWACTSPLRIGMGAAFVLGLCMDVSQSALLGQHALSYTVLSFGAIAIHRRLLWFSVPSQALQVFPCLRCPCHRADAAHGGWRNFPGSGAFWPRSWRRCCGPWPVGCCWRPSVARRQRPKPAFVT